MSDLVIRPAGETRYDAVSLGEVMLRLDPGEGRIRTARSFRAWEGGGEYNVSRGLRRAFGLRTAIVTALADNEVGRLVEDLILTGGLDTSFIRWVPYDGIGREVRNGLNFTERGFGVRGAVGVSDRGHTAAAQLAPGDVDWEHLFGHLGVRWFHTGGIFAALSDTAAADRHRGRHGRPQARHDRELRPELPAEPLEGGRWSGPRAGGQPGDRAPHRRDDRERGGLHRLAGLRGRRRRREPVRPGALVVRRDDRPGGRDVPELPGDRHDAAHGALRDGQRLGRDRLVEAAPGWSARPTGNAWRSSTGSAAETRSRPVWPTGSWRARTCRPPSSTAPRTVPSR